MEREERTKNRKEEKNRQEVGKVKLNTCRKES